MEEFITFANIEIEPKKLQGRYSIFIDFYDRLNILNLQTFNLIKIRTYIDDGRDKERIFVLENSKGSSMTKFTDFNSFISQF